MVSDCGASGGEVIMAAPLAEGEIMGEVIHEEVVAPASSSDAPVEAAPAEAAPAESAPPAPKPDAKTDA
jgi:hypothetical protein